MPAESARIGLVDGIFTRIGAVDDLAGGRSTFMIEMEETASVLRAATDRSLIVLDEIGRGTSTHDGMAIAWSVAEYLATGPVRPRAVVATHYHELAALAEVHPQVTLLRATVEERPEGVTFPHRVEPGAADRSFGIEVARLAGLPPACWSGRVRWRTRWSRSARRSPSGSAAPPAPTPDRARRSQLECESRRPLRDDVQREACMYGGGDLGGFAIWLAFEWEHHKQIDVRMLGRVPIGIGAEQHDAIGDELARDRRSRHGCDPGRSSTGLPTSSVRSRPLI